MGPVTLRDVFHVPKLDENHISVPRLTEKGLCVQTLRDKCVIKSTYGTVLAVNKSGLF